MNIQDSQSLDSVDSVMQQTRTDRGCSRKQYKLGAVDTDSIMQYILTVYRYKVDTGRYAVDTVSYAGDTGSSAGDTGSSAGDTGSSAADTSSNGYAEDTVCYAVLQTLTIKQKDNDNNVVYADKVHYTSTILDMMMQGTVTTVDWTLHTIHDSYGDGDGLWQ